MLAVILSAQRLPPLEDMPLSTRPLAEVEFLKDRPLISVSRVTDVKAGEVSFLFRYSFAADFESVVTKLKKELAGWRYIADPALGKQRYFGMNYTSGAIRRRGVTVQPYRFFRDEGSPMKTGISERERGWVCINYDETRAMNRAKRTGIQANQR